ncbi:zinc finger protein CONSTANS-LIKE 1-like [Lycium barbarum]|uniref:zinc finger protein CONSTANS-LIKE 1-like n=1 Tax=Lycium barbarum TaxID=112863 RepID=UPI00293EA471|nr:zinc finger protein CONSTANS-LIKE 1-like [Lycium barbarum]
MSSELFGFDNTFFADPFSPSFIDQHHDNNIFQDQNFTMPTNCLIQETPIDDQIASAFLSSSPPSHQLENLSLCQVGLDGFGDYSVKSEDFHVNFESDFGSSNTLMVPQSCAENHDVKLMQRSFSSNSFDNNKPSFSIFTPQLDSLIESPNFQTPALSSPDENSFSTGQMRRVCSTGDLQMKTSQTRNTLSSSPLSGERTFIEEAANIKVGRYSAEERKERIHRYRAKRTQRNFNKTIKYACRKTLADNRPRIRGRFARNDEAGIEIPKTTIFNRFEDEDDLWIEGVHEEEENQGSKGRRQFYHNFGSMTQYHQQYSSH